MLQANEHVQNINVFIDFNDTIISQTDFPYYVNLPGGIEFRGLEGVSENKKGYILQIGEAPMGASRRVRIVTKHQPEKIDAYGVEGKLN